MNDSLSSGPVRDSTVPIRKHTDSLSKKLAEIAKSCDTSSRGTISRFFRADEDAASIADIEEQMKKAIQAFQANAIIRIEKTADAIEGATNAIAQDTAALRHAEEEQRLQKSLKPVFAARHDSPTREVRMAKCADHTRVILLHEIHTWARSDDTQDIVFWLNGRAGEGKSTIANSIALSTDDVGALGGSFFFSRQGDRSLRTAALVIPSLVYQLAQHSLPFRAQVLKLLDENPAWAHLPLVSQARKLAIALERLDVPPVPPLIILDALDECDPEDAVNLLSALLGLAFRRIPGKVSPVRILVTSRPEGSLVDVFDKYCKQEYRLYEMDPIVVSHDIRVYLEHSFLQIRRQLRLPDPNIRWFTDDELDIIANRAGTLFIYAATVIRFLMKGPPGPRAQLTSILEQCPSSNSGYAALDAVYLQIISGFLRDPNLEGQSVSPYYIDILGTVLFLRDKLSINAIARLLELDPDDIFTTLQPLQSIITQPNNWDAPPTFYHASFYDYVTSGRCKHTALRFCKEERKAYLARRCLVIMKKGLKENLAEIDDSTADISTLSTVSQRIPLEIAYASRFWAYHLRKSTRAQDRSGLAQLLAGFIGFPLLYWIEVCGVLGGIVAAVQSIQDALEWMQFANANEHDLNMMQDAYRLLLAHGSSVKANPLQLYTSIWPTLPISSPIFQYLSFTSLALRALRIRVGQELDWTAHLATWTDHSEPVLSVAFSPDGKQVVSGSVDSTVRIWDVESGTCTALLKEHRNTVMSVAFSPNGKQIISGSGDATARIWDIASGTCIKIFEGHTEWVSSVAFLPSGKQVISGSWDLTIRVWDVASGACISTLTGHSGEVRSIAIGPDGTQCASASDDRTVRLWNVASTTCALTLKGHRSKVSSVAFSPDGKQVLSASEDQTIRIWDVMSGTHISTLDQSTSLSSVAYSPDGKYVVSGCRIWDLASETYTLTLEEHGDSVRSVAFSPNGKRLVSGLSDATIHLLDVASGTRASTIKGHSDRVTSVAFSPDGKQVVSGSADKTVRIWDVVSGTCSSIFEGRSGEVRSVAFSPDGYQVVSASDDVRIWDIASRTCTSIFEGHTDWVTSASFSPDGKLVVSGSEDETVRIWDVASGTCISTLEGHSSIVTSVAFSPDGKQLVSGSYDESIRFWDVAAGTCTEIYQRPTIFIASIFASAWFPAQNAAISSSSLSSSGPSIDSVTAYSYKGPVSGSTDLPQSTTHREGTPTEAVDGPRSDSTFKDGSIGSDRYWTVEDRWLGFYWTESFSRVCRLPARFVNTMSIATQGSLVAIGTLDGDMTVFDISPLLR